MKLAFGAALLRSTTLACALATTLVALQPAQAGTPKDMLVMATMLDEFSTLDPGEVYELMPEEYVANTYDRLERVDLADPSHFKGDVARSWTVSTDGLTYTFKLRPGLKFHSGNPLTADDVAWSIRRCVLLDKGAAAVLQGIGLTTANVKENVRKIDDETVSITTDHVYSPTFVLNVLGAWPASVVDRKLLEQHQQNNDFGNAWLRTHEAALAAGDARHGATVHFVTDELDGGPLVIQGELSVRPDDDAVTLAARVMDEIELKIYPQAVAWMARGELALSGSQVRLRGRILAAPVGLEAVEEKFR